MMRSRRCRSQSAVTNIVDDRTNADPTAISRFGVSGIRRYELPPGSPPADQADDVVAALHRRGMSRD
jgi:hypothetical protein